jgi:hypothetical protein
LDLRPAGAKPLTEAEIVAKCRDWLTLYSAVGLKDAPRKQFSKEDIQRHPKDGREDGLWRVEFANSKGGFIAIWLDAAGAQKKVEHTGPTLINEGPASQPADAGAAWQGVLQALQAGDKEAVARVTTSDGYESLIRNGMNGPHKDMTPEQMKSLGQAWATWELRFTKITADAAAAELGPISPAAPGLSFVRTEDGWKLDQFAPGE